MTTSDTGTPNDAGTAGSAESGPFQLWQEMLKKSTAAWSQAAAGFGGFTPHTPGAAPFSADGAMPGFESFSAFFGPAGSTVGAPQMWQQLFQTWSEQLRQNLASGPFPQTGQDAEKQWSQQLESMAATFAKSMRSEEFSQMLGKYMEQLLVWQERAAKQTNPQLDDALRAWNLPSRSQINRLFERIIGVEERLDDLEDSIRKLQGTISAATAQRRPSSFPAASGGASYSNPSAGSPQV